MFCPLWFAANYFFNLSLGLTSVASNTILSTTSGIFTLVLSILILRESPEIMKFLAVILALGGVVCIALADENEGEEGVLGDIFAIVGAVFYALYSVVLKWKG
jgi:solute carrier family 35 protein F5